MPSSDIGLRATQNIQHLRDSSHGFFRDFPHGCGKPNQNHTDGGWFTTLNHPLIMVLGVMKIGLTVQKIVHCEFKRLDTAVLVASINDPNGCRSNVGEDQNK